MDGKCKFNLNVNSNERNANKAHHSMSEAWYCHVSKARLKTPRFCTPGLCTRGLLQPEQSKSSQSCTPQNISAYPIEQQEHPKTRSSNTTVAPKISKKNKCLRRKKRRCQKKKMKQPSKYAHWDPVPWWSCISGTAGMVLTPLRLELPFT